MPSFTHPVNEHVPKPGLPISQPPTPKSEPMFIALDKIAESPFNPRKDFPAEGIAELADSIAARGLLQPLVVRALTRDQFELMAGHRRLRALRLNKAVGAQCNVILANEAQARATLIVENLQREDLGPMEEAEAFVALQKQDPKTWTTAAIAAAIGKTPRFVQQRLAMATRLDPEARRMLKEGELSVEKARVLATAPGHVQKELLGDWRLEEYSVDDLRSHILEALVPESAAGFDVALYKGGWHDEGKKRYFTDVEQFEKLQHQAAADTVARLKEKGWPTARMVEQKQVYDWARADTGAQLGSHNSHKATGKYKVAAEKVTAIVWINNAAEICSALGVAPAKAFPKPKALRSSSGGGPARETVEAKAIRTKFNDDLGAAIVTSPGMANRVLLSGLLFGSARVTYDNPAMKATAKALLPEALQGLYEKRRYTDGEDAQAWAEIKKLKDADVSLIIGGFASLIYRWSFNLYGVRKKEPEGMCALLAGELKIKVGTAAVEKAKAKPAKKKAAKKVASKKKHQ